MELTPGPNMAWLALIAAREGRRAGLMAVAGVTLGLTLLAALAATGIGLVLDAWPLAWEAVRWAGILFLLYLAIEAWIGERSGQRSSHDDARHFRRGLLVNLLNPKAAAVFVVLVPAMVPQPSLAATITHSAVYIAIATTIHLLIVAFAGSLSTFVNAPGREKPIRRVFALLLAGVAIWLAISTAR
jgi:threonine/homoserine/homoserine lactone efflux protein